jgi:hypothetical protein
VLVLLSGDKTVTTPIESTVAVDPYVNGTAMFGRERNHVGILSYKRGIKSTTRSGLPSSRKECGKLAPHTFAAVESNNVSDGQM